MAEPGRLVIVIGAKGGVGTTAIAANLAAASAGESLLLSMPSAGMGDLALWFGPAGSGHPPLDPAAVGAPELLDAVSRPVLEGLRLAEMAPGSAPAAVAGLLALSRRRFPLTVADAGPWRGRESENALARAAEEASAILVVFNRDPLAVRRAREAAAFLKPAGRPVRGVLNREDSRSGREELDAREWSQRLDGMPVLAVIPAAVEMEEAMLTGAPVVKTAGRSRCAEAFRRLALAAFGFPPAPNAAEIPAAEEHFRSPAFRELKRRLHRRFIEIERERGGSSSFRGSRDDARRVLLGLIAGEGGPDLTPGFRERLLKELTDSVVGLGSLQDFLDDDGVTEVMVNGPDAVYVERGGKISRVSQSLDGEAELRGIIERIVSPLGRRIDEASPLVDARLADGSRVNAVIPPLALDGSCLTIRKFARRRLTIKDLLLGDNLTPVAAEFLRLSISGKLNVLISGTGSGKTTLLNILASYIGAEERIVTIEDAAELQLPQEHVVRLEARPANLEGRGAVTIRDLVRNSLRMRPDRIVVGEVRGGEALDMLQAMNTGHEGSLSTLHANTPRDALSRLETMVLMAGMDLPLRAIRDQVVSALDLIVQIARLRDGTRRVVRIVEMTGLEGDVYRMQDIFVRRDAEGVIGKLVPAGLVPRIADKLAERGFRPDQAWFA